jgi:hypothetical protein
MWQYVLPPLCAGGDVLTERPLTPNHTFEAAKPSRITVTHQSGNDYYVTVDEGTTSTGHVVTVWPSDVERYAPEASPEDLLEASFQFLLEREPKESILRRFELPAIERYFPEFPRAIAGLLAR